MKIFKKPCRTIYDALNLMAICLCLLCYTSFYKRGDRFQLNRKLYFYSLSTPIVVVMGVVLGTYLIRTSPQYTKYFEEMDILLISIILMDLTMGILLFLFNAIYMQIKNIKHLHIYEHLEQLDIQLMLEFNVNMCYEKMALKISAVVWVFMLYGFIVNTAVVSSWSQGDLFILQGLCFCHTYIMLGIHIVVYNFMIVADLVRIRFRLLQKLLDPAYLRRHFSDEEVRVCKLLKAVQIYKALYEVIDEVNGVHGFCLLLCLVHDFTLTTSLVYLMIGRSSNLSVAQDLHLFVGVFCFLVPPAYKMVMTPIYCTISWNEGKKCLRIIMLMDEAFPENGRIRQIVATTLLWSTQNKYRNYGIGPTIKANLTLITMVLSAIVNYVAILIQFRIQEEIMRV